MGEKPDVDELAGLLYTSVARITRRLRQLHSPGQLSVPQRIALARLSDRPASAAELARIEQVSPQAVGPTLNALESMDLVQRSTDPADGRRVVMSLTAQGRDLLRHKQDHRTAQFSAILTENFSDLELRALAKAAPLIVRLSDLL